MKHTGFGFRRDIADDIIGGEVYNPSFIEFAPENWVDIGGYWRRKLEKAAERYPITCHGLSLSIGSQDELDWEFLKKVKLFLNEFNVEIYSEHLSYTKADNAHLYDLLPIPFRQDAVNYVVDRIHQVQDFLQRPIALENVSYYTPVAAEMSESDFINQIIARSGCDLLIDINNVYVNAFNHNYNAREFILQLPLEKVSYIHMAGHLQVSDDLIIDTHGQAIIDPVYDLFSWALDHIAPVPVLLERDFNFGNQSGLQGELKRLENICDEKWVHNWTPAYIGA